MRDCWFFFIIHCYDNNECRRLRPSVGPKFVSEVPSLFLCLLSYSKYYCFPALVRQGLRGRTERTVIEDFGPHRQIDPLEVEYIPYHTLFIKKKP
jgi:hypothetical protein